LGRIQPFWKVQKNSIRIPLPHINKNTL